MHALQFAYSSRRSIALALDLVLVVVFAIVGRASHSETLEFFGIVETGWPFVVACLIGWLVVTLARSQQTVVWPAGIIIWAVTLAGGMGLRVLAGGTTAVAFIIVAGVTLALFLLVPRLLLGRKRLASAHDARQVSRRP